MPLQWLDQIFGDDGPEKHADSNVGPIKILAGRASRESFVRFLDNAPRSYETGSGYIHLMMFTPNADHGPWNQIQNFQFLHDFIPFHLTKDEFDLLDRAGKLQAFEEARNRGIATLQEYAETVVMPPKDMPNQVLLVLMEKLGDILLDDIEHGATPGESDVEKAAGYLARRVKSMLADGKPSQQERDLFRHKILANLRSYRAPWREQKTTPPEQASEAEFQKRVLDELIADTDKPVTVQVIDDAEADLKPQG